jgi:hypothetical protein
MSQACVRLVETLAVLVDARLVIKDDEMPKRRAVQRGRDSEVQVLGADGDHPRFDLCDDRREPGNGRIVLQRHRHQAQVGAGQVDDQVIHRAFSLDCY